MNTISLPARIICRFAGVLFLLFLSFHFGAMSCWAMGAPHQDIVPDAVNLQVKKHYRVEPDGSYRMTLYVKTLINTYKGKKDRGDFRFAYNSAYEQVKVKAAKTILPDGRVVEVSPREINDIINPATQKASIFSGARVRIINFPAVEKGCIVELEIEKSSRLGFWGMESFRLLDPCREKIVTIDLPEDMPLNYHLSMDKIQFSHNVQNGRRIFQWKGEQLEKAWDDPMGPLVENVDSTLIFSSFSSWKQVGAWLLSRLSAQAKEGKAVLHEGLASARDVESLYCLLSKRLEILPLGLFDTRFHFQTPLATFSTRYGTQIDAAMLFFNILEARGLEPRLLAASSRGVWLDGLRDIFCPGFFDTLLVEAGGRFYSFDKRDLSPGITGMDGQEALLLDSGEFERIVDIRPSGSSSTYRLSLIDPSTMEYLYTTRRTGTDALVVRRMFKDLTPEEAAVADSMFFHSLDPLAHPLEPLEKSSLEPSAGPVEIRAAYRVSGFYVSNGPFHVLPVPGSSGLDAVASCPEKRKSPFFIRRKRYSRVEFDLAIPGACRPLQVPGDIRGNIGPISWEYICSQSESSLHCVRKMDMERGFVAEGEEFRRLRNAVLQLLDPEENSLRCVIAD